MDLALDLDSLTGAGAAVCDVEWLFEAPSFPQKRKSTAQALGNTKSTNWIPPFDKLRAVSEVERLSRE